MSLELARVALILAPDDPYASWYREVLEHWGIPHEVGGSETFKKRFDYDVLILAGTGEVPYGFDRLLIDYVEKGGSVIVSGSTWGLNTLLGITPRAGSFRPSSVTIIPISADDRAWPTGAQRARSLGGVYVDATDSQVIALTTDQLDAWRLYITGQQVSQPVEISETEDDDDLSIVDDTL